MSAISNFKICNYYERQIPIDGGGTGDAVDAGATMTIRVRRFTVAQLQEFTEGWDRLNQPESARMIYRKSSDDEQATRETEKGATVHLVPEAEIVRRRLREMDAETRAQYDGCRRAEEAFIMNFCADAVTKHCWLPKGHSVTVIDEDDNETVVTDGAGLVKAFGGNLAMLTRLTGVVYEENTLSPEAKKLSRSLSASITSSLSRGAEAVVDGPTPAATVEPVEAAASVKHDGASAGQDPIPSGSTQPAT